jgi:outer membrane protein assembly factor BamB
VYTVFIAGHGSQIYMARSTDGGKTFALKLVYQNAGGASLQNVFPVIAVDSAGNLYLAFSDGRNVYLMNSKDGGASWTPPVRVNDGTGTKTAIAPWVVALAPGKVDVGWWGTSATWALASNADWRVYLAQSTNALANTPTFIQSAATDVMHSGPICVNGTACPSGTRNLAEYFAFDVDVNGNAIIPYPNDKNTQSPSGAARTWFVRQSGGSSIR